MRREEEAFEPLAHRQGTRKVDRVDRPKQRGKRLGGSLHDCWIDRDEADRIERLEQVGAVLRDGVIGQLESNRRLDRAVAISRGNVKLIR